jgi:hypothetical protein
MLDCLSCRPAVYETDLKGGENRLGITLNIPCGWSYRLKLFDSFMPLHLHLGIAWDACKLIFIEGVFIWAFISFPSK